MKSRIKNVPLDDIEAISSVGAQKIANLQRKYSASTLEIIEERQKYQKKLDFWEAGFEKYGRVLIIFLAIFTCFGWLIGPSFITFINALKLSQRGISSIVWFIIGMGAYNIVDVGRIALFYSKFYPKKRDKKEDNNSRKSAHEIDDKALVEAVKNEIIKHGKMSTTNIINLLKIDVNPRDLGVLLRESGFVQQRGRSGRLWRPPLKTIDIIQNPPVDRDVDRSVDTC